MNTILSYLSIFTGWKNKYDFPPMAYDDNHLPIHLINGYVFSNNVPIGRYDTSIPIYRTKNEFRQQGKTILKFKCTYDDIIMEKLSKCIVIE